MSGFQRFYFDNGKSRKRWQVTTRGKSQVVTYGRLTGTLRQSKKSFKSPAEAKENTAKLVSKKLREGYIEVNPSKLEIVRRKGMRKATEKQIKALEAQIGCPLPEEYRNFLMTLNGGRPNPDCVQVPGYRGVDNVGVGTLFHLQPTKPGVDELSSQMQQASGFLPDGHLPIAGSSDVFTLSLREKTFGCVYWWFHETDELDDEGNFLESAGYLLASSFDEFLTRIALLFGDDEEVTDATTDTSVATKTKPKATIKRLLRLVKHDHTPEKLKEIEQTVKELGDLSDIENGEWPFINIDDPRLLRCLLKAGLNPAIADEEKQSLLWQCARSRECIDLLVKHGVDIERGSDSETPLMRAIYLESIPAVKRLVQLGANPTARLSWPIQHKLDANDKLRKVVEKARVDWKANKGKKKKKSRRATTTPKKASPPVKKTKGPKPTLPRLLRLMKHDHIQEYEEIEGVEELIIELGDLSGIQDGQWPNIHKFEKPGLLRLLLEAGLNPEITDKEGKSLLCQCAMHAECIDLLIEYGAAVDRRSGRDNATALMLASYMGDEACVETLLKAGANPTLEFTPSAKVMLSMDEEMSEIIESARKDWNRRKKKKRTKKKTKKAPIKKKRK